MTAVNGDLVAAIDARVPSCQDLRGSRDINIVIRKSEDHGKTWTQGKAIYPGSAAYSSLTVLENGDIGLLFEKDDYSENLFVSFSLEWLSNGQDQLERLQRGIAK